MTRIYRFGVSRQEAQADMDRQTNSLAGLALVLALVVASLFLIRVLGAESKVEDCLMAGRADCNPQRLLAPQTSALPQAW